MVFAELFDVAEIARLNNNEAIAIEEADRQTELRWADQPGLEAVFRQDLADVGRRHLHGFTNATGKREPNSPASLNSEEFLVVDYTRLIPILNDVVGPIALQDASGEIEYANLYEAHQRKILAGPSQHACRPRF